MISLHESLVLIVGLARDCESQISRSITKLRESFSSAKTLKFLIIESDSSDDTNDVLKRLSLENDNFNYISLGHLQEKYPKRTERIAFCRNYYLKLIEDCSEYHNVDYVVIADLDGVNDKLSKDSVVICDNGRSELPDFDPYFLHRMGGLLPQVIGSRVENRRIKDLRALVRVKVPRLGTVIVPKKINETPAYLFLAKVSDEFIEYEQDNYPGLNNESRIQELVDSIDLNGYPLDGRLITLFGDQPYIRGGQHRAAVLAAKYGLNYKIPIRVLEFKGAGLENQIF